MGNALRSVFFLLFTLLVPSGAPLLAANLTGNAPSLSGLTTVAVSQSDLQGLQLRLDRIKQQVSQANNVNQMITLQDLIQSFITDVTAMQSALLPEQKQLQAQLDVLEPVSQGDVVLEKSEIAAQRDAISEQKSKVDANIKTLTSLKDSGAGLLIQIAAIRRSLLESEVSLRAGSILSTDFWSPLFRPLESDLDSLSIFFQHAVAALAVAWLPGERLFTVILIALAFVLWTFGRQVAYPAFTWV